MASDVTFPQAVFGDEAVDQKGDDYADIHPAKTHVSRFLKRTALQDWHPRLDQAHRLGLSFSAYYALEQIRKELNTAQWLFEQYRDNIDERSVLRFFCVYLNFDDKRFNGSALPINLIIQIQKISQFISSNIQRIEKSYGKDAEGKQHWNELINRLAKTFNLSILEHVIQLKGQSDVKMQEIRKTLNDTNSKILNQIKTIDAQIQLAPEADQLTLSKMHRECEIKMKNIKDALTHVENEIQQNFFDRYRLDSCYEKLQSNEDPKFLLDEVNRLHQFIDSSSSDLPA